jgi:hypothetical protein
MFDYSAACLWGTDVYRATSFNKSVPWKLPEHIPQVCTAPIPNSKKKCRLNDTDVILPGESIDKAIVLLQIPEVLNDEAIQVLLCQKI